MIYDPSGTPVTVVAVDPDGGTVLVKHPERGTLDLRIADLRADGGRQQIDETLVRVEAEAEARGLLWDAAAFAEGNPHLSALRAHIILNTIINTLASEGLLVVESAGVAAA